MTTTNPYCQLADVKAALGLQSVQFDAWIPTLIIQAQAEIDQYIGYSFQTDGTTQTPTQRTYSGNDADVLYTGDIVSLTQVQEIAYNITVDFSGFYNVTSQTTQDITTDCVIGPSNQNPGWQLERLSGLEFHRGKRNYVVSGIFGNPTIPANIQRACIRIATHWFKMKDTAYADILVEQGGVKQRYTKQLPADVVEILEHYRKRGFYSR